MKKQTYISIISDDHGNMINFERWTCKTIEKAIVNTVKLYKDYPIYRYDIKERGATYFVVIPTPDGYTEDRANSVRVEFKDCLPEYFK